MAVYKDTEHNSWRVIYRYVDWQGNHRQTQKRGFLTRREALQWEHEQTNKVGAKLDMILESFVEIYSADIRRRIKESTWRMKENIISMKILPYLGNRKLNEIHAKDVIAWQNEMLNYRDEHGNPYSSVYLKTIHNQLSAIFNYAVKYYGLRENPAAKAGNMGKERQTEMLFWTQDEYAKFAEEMMDEPRYYYAFEMLYWCGIREGELFALTPADFNLEKGTVRINKSYQRIGRRDVITDPKTPKSNRTIQMPDFLTNEIRDYLKMLYKPKDDERIFCLGKSNLNKHLKKGAEAAGVKKIRVHDLRHSHISLLIQEGYSAVAIANRVGHESIDITYRYAHMFPSVQTEMAESLNKVRGGMQL